MLSTAFRDPVAVGLNTILTVQLAPAAKVEPHVVALWRKSPGFVPPKEKAEKVSMVGRLFLIVTDLLWLVVPTFCVNNCS
jgi:hypothetical protein